VDFQEKTIFGEFFRNFIENKAILYQNLLNFVILSAILIWMRIALKNFTQELSYVVCTQVRRHIYKQITKRRYKEEKTGRFVFRKPGLSTLGLVLLRRTPLVFWYEICTRRSSLSLLSFD